MCFLFFYIGVDLPFYFILSSVLDVMQVAHHYFENGIAYFTKRINRCISTCALSLLSYFIFILTRLSACANGEVAPFMGHNAYTYKFTFFLQSLTYNPDSYVGKPSKTPSSLIRSMERKKFGQSPTYLKISIWPSDSS